MGVHPQFPPVNTMRLVVLALAHYLEKPPLQMPEPHQDIMNWRADGDHGTVLLVICEQLNLLTDEEYGKLLAAVVTKWWEGSADPSDYGITPESLLDQYLGYMGRTYLSEIDDGQG